MDTIRQGRVGEAKIVSKFIDMEYDVYTPMFGNADCDLIVGKDGKIFRVEVKCTNYCPKDNGRYVVQLKSVRPNRTGNKIVKFDATRCEYLAIYIIDLDKVIILDAKPYHDTSGVTVGEETVGIM